MANPYELPVLDLCADLVRSIKLRRDFDQDPYGIMASYGLNNTAMEAFFTMFSAIPPSAVGTWKALWDYIWDNEVRNFVVDHLIPDPSDPDCIPPALYPNPQPMLYTFAPQTAPSGSTTVAVTVKGMGLWKQTELYLRLGMTSYKVLSGTPIGTFRCSHLTGPFDLGTVPANTYTLVARNATTSAAYQREYPHATHFVVT